MSYANICSRSNTAEGISGHKWLSVTGCGIIAMERNESIGCCCNPTKTAGVYFVSNRNGQFQAHTNQIDLYRVLGAF